MGYPQEGGKTSGKRLCLVEESPKGELGEGLSAANISRSWGPSIWVLARGGGIRISHLSVIYIYIYACMRAKSLQSYLTFCEPYGLQPARFLCSWDSPGKNMKWVAMPSP